MKALLLESRGHLRAIARPAPEPEPDEVVLRVSHCAVCRTDAKMWQQGHRDLVLPRILGHEICAFSPGRDERFVIWPGKACGECGPCRAGFENLCRHMSIQGFHRDGGFAELVAAPSSSLIPVPTHLPGPLACLAEPLGCALNGLDQTGLSPGMSLLLYGGGTLGLLAALAARELGAEVHLVETNRAKLERSRAIRTTFGIGGNLACPHREFDAALNAAPSLNTFSEGLGKLKAGGRFCLFSGLTGCDAVPAGLLNEIHYRQLHAVGAYGCTREQMTRALTLLEREGNSLEGLIEDCIRLEEVPATLPSVLSGEAFKYVVNFSGAI
jgi:L-iditol 2-dehydrogenase